MIKSREQRYLRRQKKRPQIAPLSAEEKRLNDLYVLLNYEQKQFVDSQPPDARAKLIEDFAPRVYYMAELDGTYSTTTEFTVYWDYMQRIFQSKDRFIAKDYIGAIMISTVFMPSLVTDGLGYCFETMIFGGELSGTKEQSKSREEALETHQRLKEAVLNYSTEIKN